MNVILTLNGDAVSQYTSMSWVDEPRALQITDENGKGWTFIVSCEGSDPTITRAGNGNLTFSCYADISTVKTPTVYVTVIPTNAANGETLSPWLNPNSDTSVSYSQIKMDDTLLTEYSAPFDPVLGAYRIDLKNLQNIAKGLGSRPNWSIIEQQNYYNRHKFTISNTSSTTMVVPIAFFGTLYSSWTMTGGSPMIRSLDGQPTGIPVQISKDWHGTNWFHLYT